MTLLAAALALALAQNPAADAPREAPPPPRPPPDFRLPETHAFTLENGLAVTLVEMGQPPRRPSRSCSAPARATTRRRRPGSRASSRRSSRRARPRAAPPRSPPPPRDGGGAIETSVTPDETVVGGTVLSEFAPELVALVADVAMNPAFPPREVERVRQDSLRSVTIARSQPQVLAQERFLATLYPGHPYGQAPPHAEIVRGYTVDDARAFQQASYGARRAHLYVAGRFDRAATEARIRAVLRGAGRAPRATPPPSPTSRRAVELVPRAGAVQSSLYLGLPVLEPRHPDYLKLALTNTLLGGYFLARHGEPPRGEGVHLLALQPGIGARRHRVLGEVADVTTAVTGASLKEIFAEVERLRAEPPAEAELRAVQAYLAGTFVLQTSDRDGLIARLRFVDLHGSGRGGSRTT